VAVPQPATYGTFDLTFDATFRGVLLSPAQPSEEGCRTAGALLHWLSPTGWATWLFDGVMTRRKVVASRGQYVQARTTLHTQKESAWALTVRTVGITTDEARAVATIYDSISVYLLAPDSDGVFQSMPVNIDPGTFDIDDSSRQVHDLEVSFILPGYGSQRR